MLARLHLDAGMLLRKAEALRQPLDALGADKLVEHTAAGQLHGEQPANSWDLVFVGGAGEPLNPRAVWPNFRRKLVAAGVPAIRFHDLRHSTASLLLLAGVPARMVQEILGHSSIGLTVGTYSHMLPGLREQALAAQAAMLG